MNSPIDTLRTSEERHALAVRACTATYCHNSELGETYRLEPTVHGLRLTGFNFGEGAPSMEIVTCAEEAAWLAVQLIRIYGLKVEAASLLETSVRAR